MTVEIAASVLIIDAASIQDFAILMIIALLVFAGLLFFSNPYMMRIAFFFIGSVGSIWVAINAIIVRFVD